MNKKELIKLLDKYEIEYEITDNTKEVEEGLRLFDEALEKIGIVISKGTRVDTITTEDDLEVPKYTTEWTSSSDLISRQAAIRAMCQECAQGGYDECSVDCVEAEVLRKLPPVEPPKKVVAQIKVDIDELIERIKEEYKITEKPVCEDAISKEWVLKELKAEVKKDYPSFRRVMDKIKDAPPVEPKRPKGEWVDRERCQVDEDAYDVAICPNCKAEITLGDSNDNFCPKCGCDCRGDKE